VHNNQKNATTRLSPNQVLLGYEMTLNPTITKPMSVETVEKGYHLMMEQWVQAITAINQAVEKQGKPEAQYTMGAQVWLKGKNLKLPYQMTKLVPQ
jgi:hypothetical protein